MTNREEEGVEGRSSLFSIQVETSFPSTLQPYHLAGPAFWLTHALYSTI